MRTRTSVTERKMRAAEVAGVTTAPATEDESKATDEGSSSTDQPEQPEQPEQPGQPDEPVSKPLPPSLRAHTVTDEGGGKPIGSNGVTRASKVQFTGFEKIIDSVFTFDTDAVYEEVLQCLQFTGKASRTEYGMLIDALDASEENARRAHQLVANAKVASTNYQSDIDVLQSSLREQSVNELMAAFNDPKNTTVTKKPTNDDIHAYMVANYHDEWKDMEVRVSKAKRMVEYLESLAELCNHRARDLRQMLASFRGA